MNEGRLERLGRTRALAWVLALAPVAGTHAGLSIGSEAETGLRFWAWQGEGMALRLVQRLPDQTRAFFLARGFDAEAADAIALGCVFQTIFENTAPGAGAAIEYDLAAWRVHSAGASHPPRLDTEWDAELARQGASEAARIALRWSFLPTRQRFEPGDYNWGMTSFGLAPGARFDLDLAWSREGVAHRARIPGLECAEDRQP